MKGLYEVEFNGKKQKVAADNQSLLNYVKQTAEENNCNVSFSYIGRYYNCFMKDKVDVILPEPLWEGAFL